jgi:hypothetical protein
MPWGFAAAAVGSIVGGVMSGQGAQDAAQTQANAANAATQAQLDMYNQNVQRLSPWTNAGGSALSTLQGMMPTLTQQFGAQQYQQSPGYQWQLGQGINAIQNSAAATGGVNSGNTMKALMSYGQGLANQDYYNALNAYTNWQNQVYNMYSGISNTGANAAGQVAGIGANTANAIGNNITGAGNARAAGQVAAGNTMGNTLGSLGNLGLMYQMQGGFGGGGGGGGMPNIPSSAYTPDYTQSFAPSGIMGA